MKGICTIKIIDSKTNEVKQIIEKENVITDKTYRAILGWSAYQNPIYARYSGVFGSCEIAISTAIDEPRVETNVLTKIIGATYTPDGQTKRSINVEADPIFGQIYGRINFTGAERTFYTVGLVSGYYDANSNNLNNINADVYAYLLLDTPCIQGSYDYLDIFYRIQFLEGELTGFEIAQKDVLKALADNLFGFVGSGGGLNMSGLFVGVSSVVDSAQYPYNRFNFTRLVKSYYGRDDSFPWLPDYYDGWASARVESLYKFKDYTDFSLEKSVGAIFNCCSKGVGLDTPKTLKPYFDNQTSPLQNLFTHSNNAVTPFFDSLKLASGTGKVLTSLSSNGWTKKVPQLYKITITTGGNVGNAAYKISARSHLGFNGNNYEDVTLPSPYTFFSGVPGRLPFNGAHGCQGKLGGYYNNELTRNDNNIKTFSDTELLFWDDTGITIVDLFDGRYRNYDVGTALKQVALDKVNNRIYTACRNTGLWIIDVATGEITRVSTTPCYGVDVGRNNVAFAIFEGRVSNSNNWNTPLTFNFSNITTQWNRARFLKVDPEHIEDRICISYDSTYNESHKGLCWYRGSDGATFDGGVWDYYNTGSEGIDVSDTGSFWVLFSYTSYLFKLNFGSNSHNLVNSYRVPTNVNFIDQQVVTASTLVNSQLQATTSYSQLANNHLILLNDNIVFNNNQMRVLFTGNTAIWRNYGWNGTAWELNNNGAKTTHLDEQNLIDGLTIKFEDGGQAPSFVATDYYTQSANWGLLKDNATTLYFEGAWYSRPLVLDYPIQLGAAVPITPLQAATTAKYWRIRSTTPAGGYDRRWYVREVIFRDSAGDDITNGGFVSVSHPDNNSYPPSNAVDKATNQLARVSEQDSLGWIAYTFASDVTVTSVSINQHSSSYNICPTNYVVETSNDSVSWQGLWVFTTGTTDNIYYNSTYDPAINAVPGEYKITLEAASDPNFIAIEVDDATLTDIKINNQAIATLYLNSDSPPPGPNECTIYMDGRVRFNAVDAGKTVTGSYSWIKRGQIE